MGDVIMSNSAFMQIKAHYPHIHLTLLTSSMGAPIAPYLGTIDEVLVFDAPWMKNEIQDSNLNITSLVTLLQAKSFDACIIFNVYSQNILPAAMLCYMANIPIRAAYSRENPYYLLTDWVPDPEPLRFVHHQISRDLLLLKELGFPYTEHNNNNFLTIPEEQKSSLAAMIPKNYVVVNLDVSESKRQFPIAYAIDLIKNLQAKGKRIVLTGVDNNIYFQSLKQSVSEENIIDLIGKSDMIDLLHLIHRAQAIITVNTGVAHIACAYKKPVLVLYADTNPQHLPWSENSLVYVFPIEYEQRSKNEIIKYVDVHYERLAKPIDMDEIITLVEKLLGMSMA